MTTVVRNWCNVTETVYIYKFTVRVVVSQLLVVVRVAVNQSVVGVTSEW
jgi:hypothetical protein